MKREFNILWHIFICVFLLGFHSAAFSQPSERLSTLTQQLMDTSAAIKAGKMLSTEELNKLKKVIKQRRELLNNEFNHYKDVSSQILSKKTLELLPREIQQQLENETGSFVGTLKIRVVDLDNKKEAVEYLLYAGNEIYYLHFTDGAPTDLESDAKITIHHAMKIKRSTDTYHLILSHKDIEVVNPRVALPLSIGPQRTVTMLINFIDQPNNRPWTFTQVNDLVYGTMSDQYWESSYHQTTVVGQSVGWYVINLNSSTCDADQIANLADQAAKNAGVDLSQYRRKLYLFPRISACGWAGLGEVGGTQTRAWINGYLQLSVIGHEMGHNFGLAHARMLKCPTSPNTGTCTRVEYGDGTDMMGNVVKGAHFNAFMKDRLGWLNYQTSPPITTVTTSGTYTIDAYETLNQNPKALRVLKRAGGTDYYYLEFRQGIGFDAELATCTACDYTHGVVFHQGNINVGDSSDLLDMTPGGGDRLVALLPGQRWTDPAAPNGGVTFEVVSVQSTGAIVKITYGTVPPPPTETQLENNVPVSGISGSQSSEKFYYIDVPTGKPSLTVNISGGTGDADLYVQYGQRPSKTLFQCRPYLDGNNETCKFNSPAAGKYFIMLRGYLAFNNVTLTATY